MHANLLLLTFLIKCIACKEDFHSTISKNRSNKNIQILPQMYKNNYEKSAPNLVNMAETIQTTLDLNTQELPKKLTNEQAEIMDFDVKQRSFFPRHSSSYKNNGRLMSFGSGGGGSVENPSYSKSSYFFDDSSNVEGSPWQEKDEPINNIDNNKNRNHQLLTIEKKPEKEVNGNYHHYHHFEIPNWNNDPWKNEAMITMNSLIPAMMVNGIIPDSNKKGFSILDKLTNIDPKAILVAGIIPLGLLLAAVLPSFMQMMTNGNGLPTFTTTASGNSNSAEGVRNNNIRYLETTLEMLIKNLDQHFCLRQVICRITKESIQKTYQTVLLDDPQWIESLGLKKFFDYFQETDCGNIPCTTKLNNSHTFFT